MMFRVNAQQAKGFLLYVYNPCFFVFFLFFTDQAMSVKCKGQRLDKTQKNPQKNKIKPRGTKHKRMWGDVEEKCIGSSWKSSDTDQEILSRHRQGCFICPGFSFLFYVHLGFNMKDWSLSQAVLTQTGVVIHWHLFITQSLRSPWMVRGLLNERQSLHHVSDEQTQLETNREGERQWTVWVIKLISWKQLTNKLFRQTNGEHTDSSIWRPMLREKEFPPAKYTKELIYYLHGVSNIFQHNSLKWSGGILTSFLSPSYIKLTFC